MGDSATIHHTVQPCMGYVNPENHADVEIKKRVFAQLLRCYGWIMLWDWNFRHNIDVQTLIWYGKRSNTKSMLLLCKDVYSQGIGSTDGYDLPHRCLGAVGSSKGKLREILI